MATNAKALKALYEALGGEEELVNPSNLECLNAIAELGGGEAQDSNAKAIMEIAENPPSGGGGGGSKVQLGACVITNSSTGKITVDSLELDEGTGFIVPKMLEIVAGRTETAYLVAGGLAEDGVTPYPTGVLHITYATAVGNSRTVTATKGNTAASVLASNNKDWYSQVGGTWDTGELAITVANAT